MSLTLDEFKSIRDLVYAECGMYFKEEKMYFLENRLQARLESINCSTVAEYLQFLRYDRSKSEMETLIDSLTTNETFFFRDKMQIDGFADEVLPMLVKNKLAAGRRTLRIWSAGCSTGDEPYTLAMLVMEKLRDHMLWDIQILATDISQRVLTACRTAVYPPRSLKDVPDQFKDRYFTKSEHTYKVNFEVKKLVQFGQLNLSNRGMMRTVPRMDCIFCRNVLIYFGDEAANMVVNSFYDTLNPGGVLFLGHSESMHRYSAAFKMQKLTKCFVYKKE